MGDYVIVWQYQVRPEAREQFEAAYGPDGAWVRFFRQADGYRYTRLFQDVSDAGRFITLDTWRSEEAFLAFTREHKAGYEALDRSFEALTVHEVRLCGVCLTEPPQEDRME